MEHVKDVIEAHISPYTGSQATRDMIEQQIKDRWGDEESKNYDPYTNCLTFKQWFQLGYKVKKGQKSLRSITFVEKLDELGRVEKKFPRTVCLFYHLQVEKIPDHENQTPQSL